MLIRRDKIEPELAEFAARVSQGHIGRARYLATNETARKTRNRIMQIPLELVSLSSAFQAAQALVDIATEEAEATTKTLDELEIEKLLEAYGKDVSGRGMALGGSKALKDLEKDQKTRRTRAIRDAMESAILELSTFYRDVMMFQCGNVEALINSELAPFIGSRAKASNFGSIIQKLDAVLKTRAQLVSNPAPLAASEALMCTLAQP